MANETILSSIINPQVLADMIERKLVDAMKFTPLCKVDNTLVGRAGDTVTLPQYAYIGDASDVEELANISISELTASTQAVKVKKVGKGATISDEAVLSGYGDPVGEIGKQLTTSIASKVDNDVLTALADATYIHPVVTVTPSEVNLALVKLGEDYEGDKYLFVSPASYAALRACGDWLPASDVAANLVISGTVGMLYGCVVVVTNKISANNVAYIVKPGAVALFMKRGTMVESDRNIVNKSTTFTADKHYAAYLYDASKVVKMGAATLTELTVTQDADIANAKASFTVTGFPTNLPYGWKAYCATGLGSATSVAVGDAYSTVSSTFGTKYEPGTQYAAVNGKVFQVIYIDADSKIRASGNVTIATTVS